ncbi:MAG TPA: GNAT family N-acetyltransferase [Pyrinomonadaceae bacterium]|nr:GNAT family N-acetyltransferase [Pyrinomonadaceae bacterium]
MTIKFKVLQAGDEQILSRVAPDVFDYQIDERLTAEFLQDPRHHLAVAIDEEVVVGFASAVSYIHPDKPAELWINEVGVSPTHHRRGVARALLESLFRVGRQEGCSTAWVLTERENTPAMRLYQSCRGEEAEGETVMFSFNLKQ